VADIIPEELTQLRRWHCWNEINGTKIPMQVHGEPAKSNDPSTWTSYEIAVAHLDRFTGLAFEISAPYCGIDLDNCIDEEGELREWAKPIVEKLSPVAYGEVSPSGNGIKFTTRARKLKGARCVHVFGPDKQQLECYDHGRFWAMTTHVWDQADTIEDGQEVIDGLVTEFLYPDKPAKRKRIEVVVEEMTIGTTLIDRARTYANNADPANEGGRNNAAFRLSGHLFKFEHFGERLSESQILELVQGWNDRNADPLPDQEIESVVSSGGRNGKPREEKPATTRIEVDNSDIDLSLLLDELSVPEGVLTRGAISKRLITGAPGLLGEVCQWINETALYVLPEVTLASAIGLMSVITGRKICDRLNTRTNLYLLSIAPTSSGKDWPRTRIQELLLNSGAEDICGAEDIGSAAGLSSALQESPALLMQLDEFGKLIQQVSGDRVPTHLAQISGDFLKLYSSAGRTWKGRAYADTKRSVRIDQPHLVINGTTTAQTLWGTISEDQVFDGLLGRIQIFEATGYARLKDVIPTDRERIPEELIEQVKYWIDFKPEGGGDLACVNPTPATMKHTPDAWDRLEDHMRAISDKRCSEDPQQAAIWSRSAEKASKLAMIAAASCRSLTVSLDHVEWAIALQNALTRKLLIRIGEHVSSNANERLKKKILSILKGKKEMTLRDFTRKTQFLRDRKERQLMIEELLDAEQITVWKEESEGKKPITKIKLRTSK
tara:strand:+ start:39814 stop:41973 length:2160 start_codon:yes stop_codon:yes gene_type:complete